MMIEFSPPSGCDVPISVPMAQRGIEAPARPSPWAADLYQRAHDHPHAVRILARAWLRVIWRCWQDGVPYDPTKHRALQAVLDRAA